MKVQLNKKIKIILILVLIIINVTISSLLYQEVTLLTFEEQENSLFSYNNKGTTDYTVFLKPNNLYSGNSLEEGKLYILEFIDHINTNFIYDYSGQNEVNIKGYYDIAVKVQGITVDNNQIKTIWEKDFPIVHHTNFSSTNGQISINEEVNINLDEYNTFVKETIEATKINCDTILTLLMDINLTGTTDHGTFEEHITPNIVIPLNTPMFEITTNNIEKEGAIEETIQVPVPVDKNKVILYGAIIGISALGLIFLIFFTKPAPKKDALEIALNKIFKKHGDRLVALSSGIDISNARLVRSFDDLVRLADEINKPILYEYSDDYKEINKFFITNDDEIYSFELEGLIIPEEVTEQATEEVPADIE